MDRRTSLGAGRQSSLPNKDRPYSHDALQRYAIPLKAEERAARAKRKGKPKLKLVRADEE